MHGGISALTLKRGVRRGLRDALRDARGGATLTLLTIAVTLLQMLLLSLGGVAGLHQLLVSRGDLYLEVLASASDADVQEFYAAVRAHPNVSAVEYIPSEQAYEREKARNPDLVRFVEEYGIQNPFPDAFSVTLTSLSAYEQFVDFLGQDPWQRVVDPSFLSSVTTQEQDVQQLLHITDTVRSFLVLFIIVAVLLLIVLVGELIAHRARRHGDEFLLESLIGAPLPMVVIPFVAEMTAFLAAALVIGSLVTGLLLLLLQILASGFASDASFTELKTEILSVLGLWTPVALLVELLLAPAIAFVAMFLGLRHRGIWPKGWPWAPKAR